MYYIIQFMINGIEKIHHLVLLQISLLVFIAVSRLDSVKWRVDYILASSELTVCLINLFVYVQYIK